MSRRGEVVVLATEDGGPESKLEKLLFVFIQFVCETADRLIDNLVAECNQRDLFFFFSIRQKLETTETSLTDPDNGDSRTKDVGHSVFL